MTAWKRYRMHRRMAAHAKRHEWKAALVIARQLNDKQLRELFAMARIAQLLNEVEQ